MGNHCSDFDGYWNFTPGPYSIPETIKTAMLREPPYFASPQFCEYYSEFLDELQCLCGTRNHVVVGCGSGSMGLQAAVMNFVRPGNLSVILSAGKYGKLWYSMASDLGAEVLCIQSQDGIPINENRLKTCLQYEGHKIKCVMMQHVETTTGIRNPIEEYAKWIREKTDAIIMIDAVSSLLVENINPDLYDVVVGASQKGFNCPPGLFFMIVSEKAAKLAYSICTKFTYFNVVNELERCQKGITTFTPATVLIQAMKAAIVEINNIGRDLIIAETRRISDAVKRRLSLAYEIIPVDNAYRANGVTCFRVDEEEKLYHYLLDNKIVVGDGVGIHRGKLIRLGHMGWNLNVDALHKVVDMIIDRRKGKQNV